MGFWGILLFSATPHSCQSVWKAASSHVSRRLPVGSLANRVSKYPVSWKTHVGIREKEVGKAVSFFYSHPLLPGLGGAYPLTAAVAGGSDRVGQAENAHSCWGPFFGGDIWVCTEYPKIQGLNIIFPPLKWRFWGMRQTSIGHFGQTHVQIRREAWLDFAGHGVR